MGLRAAKAVSLVEVTDSADWAKGTFGALTFFRTLVFLFQVIVRLSGRLMARQLNVLTLPNRMLPISTYPRAPSRPKPKKNVVSERALSLSCDHITSFSYRFRVRAHIS